MALPNFNDLAAFVVVAREQSFTKAAAKLGVSQSSLSQTIRGLEERLDIRLLTRTTRSVAPTDAGAQLLKSLEPRFEEIQGEVNALSEMKDRPSGTIRITAGEHPALSVIGPALPKFLGDNPGINVEIIVDYGLTDIVAERYDAGVRLGAQIARDMIAVRISPDICMAVVGTPDYFARFPAPVTPEDLTGHNCINIRLPTYGTLFPWEFEKHGHEIKVRVEGQAVFNNTGMRLASVLEGIGLSYLPEDQVLEHIAAGRLVRVLEDWSPTFTGYHLYYPNRRHHSAAFSLFVDAMRYRGAAQTA
ncbi:DNA-binding transcriptional regulator, LysR family [Devosia sp. YR412]|uniref:LysR family transcriptional regulator n=1 Tax=Devosia sp. YR412 TaxID=1881030 RepID=UPI0008C52339|nr:LysR family transcriptional regulator [Devosia sp. YR412]SEQ29858.1 DNA-binding transcriptional regulator, LysR family [Devosia sp. YR412]